MIRCFGAGLPCGIDGTFGSGATYGFTLTSSDLVPNVFKAKFDESGLSFTVQSVTIHDTIVNFSSYET